MRNILNRPISRINKGTNKIKQPDPIKNMAESFLGHLEAQIHNQDAQDSEFNESLDATLDEFGFTGEARAKCKSLFIEAVNRQTTKLQDGIANIVGQYFSVDGNIVDAMSQHVAALEAEIDFIDAENEQLATKLTERLSESYSLNEDTMESLWAHSDTYEQLETKCHQAAKPERAPKKSHIEEDMECLNDDGTFAGQDLYIDPQMRKYLNYL
jgi:hypothetical protein